MIKLRHQQPSLGHRGLAEDIEGLWEPWMRLVDELLEDEQLVDTVYEAQGERHPQSRIRGRMQTPAEVLLRLLLPDVMAIADEVDAQLTQSMDSYTKLMRKSMAA